MTCKHLARVHNLNCSSPSAGLEALVDARVTLTAGEYCDCSLAATMPTLEVADAVVR
jgi:hypothetical protein